MLHNPRSELQAPGEKGYILGWAGSPDILALLIPFPQGRTCPLYTEEKNWGPRGLAEVTVAARQNFKAQEPAVGSAGCRLCGVHRGSVALELPPTPCSSWPALSLEFRGREHVPLTGTVA